MRIVKAFFRATIGLIFGLLSALLLVPGFAAFSSADDSGAQSGILIAIVLVGILFGIFAPTIRRAFGRGFLMLGASMLILPISMMLLSGRVASDLTAASGSASSAEQAGTAIGAGLAGVFMTGASAIIGIVFGAIFLIAGLVLALGGRREVVVRS